MKRSDFLKNTSKFVLISPLVSELIAETPMKIKSAYKLPLGQELPDPFCLKTEDGYFLTGTHHSLRKKSKSGGYLFDMFHSRDLINWVSLGQILKFPDFEGSREGNFWAPEIVPYQGKYYLYYTADSFGNPEKRYVRVAVAEKVNGPYEDCQVRLTEQPSIDGDPYYVSADEGYLFYTGNEGNEHVGQLLVDKFVSPTRLENKPRKVFPSETVPWEEGAFLVKKDNGFYLFSSQGNWRNETYHVLAAKAESILGPYVRCAKENSNLRVLSTQGVQIGPGHNSVFQGPNSEYYICYHAWDRKHTGRYCWIAPLEWKDGFPAAKQ